MSNSFPTKANIPFTTIHGSNISANDVYNHLQNTVLGIPIKMGFLTWHGPAASCYVVSKVCIPASEIASTAKPTDFVSKVLADYNANTCLRKDIVDLIKPFMFPNAEELGIIMRDVNAVKNLANIGIAGNNLQELMMFRDFRYSPQTGYYVIYLDTEKIIRDMVKDPTSDKINGSLRIASVVGEKDEQIRWEIYITETKNGFGGGNGIMDVSLDRILATVR